jgi:hypothetical protein
LALLAAISGTAAAHGTVGDYTFIEPLVTEDANPKNEFSILRPSWVRTSEGKQFTLGFSLEKKLSEEASVSIGSSWIDQRNLEEPAPSGASFSGAPVRRTRTGFDNFEVLLKYAFLTVEAHEFRLSGGLEMSIPTGDPGVGAETHFRLGPELLWAKGMGDLPNSGPLKYLRPIGLQGDVGYTANTTGRAVHELFADEVIEYSIPYLTNSVRDFGLPWPLRNLYLYTEFNYEQLIAGPPGETFPAVNITPGVAFLNQYLEISVATQFALNQAAVRENHAAILGLLDLFLDDIIPAANWTPF